MLENYIIAYENLPFKVSGFIIYDAVDDYYTIVLNRRLSFWSNKKTFEHEIGHILNGDFFKIKNVEMLEMAMH